MHVEVRVKVTKNIFLFLIFLLFSTNLYANCSQFYKSLGKPSKVSLLWLDDKNGKQAQYALINKIGGDQFTLCKRTRFDYSIEDSNKEFLKDLDVYEGFSTPESAFNQVFKITSEETTRYILSKLYLPDYSISKSNLVTQFALSQKEEQVSKYITKKPSKKIKKEKKQSSYITKKKKKKTNDQDTYNGYLFCRASSGAFSPYMADRCTWGTLSPKEYVLTKMDYYVYGSSVNNQSDKKRKDIYSKTKASIIKQFRLAGLDESLVINTLAENTKFVALEKPIQKKPQIVKKPKKKIEKIVKKPKPQKQKELKVVVQDLDETPPELKIKTKYVFDKPNYVIKGSVRDKGSKKLYVFVDDQMIKEKNGRFEIKRFSPGSEKLEVKAVDQWGNEVVKIIDVEIKATTQLVEKLEPLNPSKIRNVNRGNVVALIIGIESYSEAPKAIYANRDAEFFAEYARYAFGASRNNIKLLIDKDATSTKMYGALEKWLPAKIQSDQTDVIVFFAGHGLASVDGKNLYLLMQDSDTDLLSRTALSRTELFKLINQHNPKSVKMFFDTCYSGQSRDEKTLLASARPIRIGIKESDGVPDNFTVFTASQDDQISSGLKEAKHGIFSYYLMKGLEGQADKNKDREITNGELLAYMENKVNSKAVEIGRNQIPSLVGKKDITLNRY